VAPVARVVLNGMALCAGAGGLELGLRLALGDRYRSVVYVEREAYAAAALVARMDDEALDRAPIWDDLTTIDAGQWRGVVDLVTAGFPCQPWSVAGKRQGTADDRWLWPAIARIIRDVQPELVFIENVPGLLRHGLALVLEDLAALGFDAEWGSFRARDIGAPHKRDRVFVLAYAIRSRSGEQRAGWERVLDIREGVADADGSVEGERLEVVRREHRSEDGRQAAAEHRDGGRSLADADGAGFPRERIVRLPGHGHAPHRDDIDGCDPSVADTDGREQGARRGGRAPGRADATEGRAARQFRLAPFPPGPGDAEAWGRILAARPDLAPAVAYADHERGDRLSQRHAPGHVASGALRSGARTSAGTSLEDVSAEADGLAPESELRRLAHGMAARVDRLRTAGNGVVSVLAGYAFLTLAGRARVNL
jgi:DNA (cytosine-5)-methyltransferase 1